MEKTRAQIRLERLAQEQKRLQEATTKARALHRQQRKRQKAIHAGQLGQLMQDNGFEHVSIEQAEQWLKMALVMTPLWVRDETARLPTTDPQAGSIEAGERCTLDLPLSRSETPNTHPLESKPEESEAESSPISEPQPEGSGVQNLRTSEPETGERHSS
jgi:hypothetical protein